MVAIMKLRHKKYERLMLNCDDAFKNDKTDKVRDVADSSPRIASRVEDHSFKLKKMPLKRGSIGYPCSCVLHLNLFEGGVRAKYER
jgi:hypothetical protein